MLSLGPPDRTGVLKVLSVAIARDGAAYAYAYTQLRGQLYVADGLR